MDTGDEPLALTDRTRTLRYLVCFQLDGHAKISIYCDAVIGVFFSSTRQTI